MMETDFTSTVEMREWFQNYCPGVFRFLIDEYGFLIGKNEITGRQYSLEFQKNDLVTGLWMELGTRPEVFMESGDRRLFTDRLISAYASGMKLPVRAAVFGKRMLKRDYHSLLAAYADLMRTCLDARSCSRVKQRGVR